MTGTEIVCHNYLYLLNVTLQGSISSFSIMRLTPCIQRCFHFTVFCLSHAHPNTRGVSESPQPPPSIRSAQTCRQEVLKRVCSISVSVFLALREASGNLPLDIHTATVCPMKRGQSSPKPYPRHSICLSLIVTEGTICILMGLLLRE